jgi:MIP family channel proteins
MNWNKYLSELVGTFLLVFAGCGAIVVNDSMGGPLGHVGICLVFGLIVMVLIYSVGNVSGAHFNPAVTLGFYFSGRLKAREIAPYITAQVVGAIAAAALLRALFPAHTTLGSTLPAGGEVVRAFVFETILTFALMYVILNVATGWQEKGIMAGAAIGGTVALDALFGGPICGASMNPARSIGPALVSGQTATLWIYLAAPVLGALLAYPACRCTQGSKCCPGLGGPKGPDDV